MQVEIYESDPFTAKKQDLLAKLSSDYRFQKGDELYIHKDGGTSEKVRVIDVRVHVREGGELSSEILAMRI